MNLHHLPTTFKPRSLVTTIAALALLAAVSVTIEEAGAAPSSATGTASASGDRGGDRSRCLAKCKARRHRCRGDAETSPGSAESGPDSRFDRTGGRCNRGLLSPVAEFSWSPAHPADPPVRVSLASTGSCPAAPCAYDWSHASAQFATGTTAEFTYQRTGTKTVTLDVTDARGRTATVQHQFNVTGSRITPPPPPPPGSPTAAFDFSPVNPTTGESVAFNGTPSACPAGPCTYAWEDDGPDGRGGDQWPLGTGQSLSFTFHNAGTKSVRLTVIDAQGRTDSVVHDVVVATSSPPPPAPPPPPPAPPPPPPTPPGTPVDGFPNRSNTGVPTGWTPAQTRSTDMFVREPGTVVQDVLFTNGADIFVEAPNVTIRRVELEGGRINNLYGPECANGLLIEDTTIEPRGGQDYGTDTEGVISYGGYTARGVEIWHRSEGFRVGGVGDGCGPVRIEDSFAAVTPPQPCGDWHGDGIQGYDGPALTVRNVTLDLDITGCGGTAPFFYPAGQGNTSVDIDRLLVTGGGAPFRLGMPGSVSNLKIENNSWVFFPIDVKCSVLSHWDAELVTINSDYQVTSVVGPQPCDTEAGE